MQPGWYPDPWEKARLRWWDGWRWTPATHGMNARDRQLATSISIGGAALAVIGAALPLFTNVSLLTGTGTVWTGAAMTLLVAVGVTLFRQVSSGIKILRIVLAVAAVASGIYDEVQLQHNRDEISRIFP
jgi:multidrug transporter EmrE-like cation transporter